MMPPLGDQLDATSISLEAMILNVQASTLLSQTTFGDYSDRKIKIPAWDLQIDEHFKNLFKAKLPHLHDLGTMQRSCLTRALVQVARLRLYSMAGKDGDIVSAEKCLDTAERIIEDSKHLGERGLEPMNPIMGVSFSAILLFSTYLSSYPIYSDSLVHRMYSTLA